MSASLYANSSRPVRAHGAAAKSALSVDRLFGQLFRRGNPARPAPGRSFRAPQHRQSGARHRYQYSKRAAIRRRFPASHGHHRLRSQQLRRDQGRCLRRRPGGDERLARGDKGGLSRACARVRHRLCSSVAPKSAVYHAHAHEFDTPPTARDLDRLSRLNTIAQVENVCRSAPVRHAWENGQALSVHGLLYTVADGRLHDLDVSVNAKARFQGNDGIAGSASRD